MTRHAEGTIDAVLAVNAKGHAVLTGAQHALGANALSSDSHLEDDHVPAGSERTAYCVKGEHWLIALIVLKSVLTACRGRMMSPDSHFNVSRRGLRSILIRIQLYRRAWPSSLPALGLDSPKR